MMAVTLCRGLRLVSSWGSAWLANRLTPQGCLSNDTPTDPGNGTHRPGGRPVPVLLKQVRVNLWLAGWIHQYNHHRTDTAIGNKPPISRVTDLPDQNG